MLTGKKIVLAVTGSIAAYKSLLLVRLLIKEGCEVRVIMTSSATNFVSQLSFATLSNHTVYVDFFKDNTWANHVELGLWADLMIIAPASANTIAKAANGVCDNMVLATYLSSKCPVIFAPAMDLDMYLHPSTKHNLINLKSYGNHIIEATYGELASRLVGQGRMEEPENIVDYVKSFFVNSSKLYGKNLLITAGPTYEALDPVRFIGNHSSGKMGWAITKEALNRGALVNLVLGPTSLMINPHANLSIHHVSSAQQMYEASKKLHDHADISIFSAAVADYRPKDVAEQKIKKNDSNFALELIKNVDIAYELGKIKKANQVHVGFALETENEEINAKGKLAKKNFDLIVLNSANEKGAGFKHDTNKIKLISNKAITTYELKSKDEVAKDILDQIEELL